MFCLAGSHFSINKSFVIECSKRAETIINYNNESMRESRNRLNLMNSFSLIEKNMKLGSAYLPELSRMFEVNLYSFVKSIHLFTSQDLINFSNFFRRICFYHEPYLAILAQEALKRTLEEFSTEDVVKEKVLSLDALCSILHTLAAYNYR